MENGQNGLNFFWFRLLSRHFEPWRGVSLCCWAISSMSGGTVWQGLAAILPIFHWTVLGLWYDPFEHLLDYTSGEATCTQDQPGEFDRNGIDELQDVVEYWAVDWSKHGNSHEPPHRAGTRLGLGVAWYRDVLRAKMVSLRLPRRLLLEYKQEVVRQVAEIS